MTKINDTKSQAAAPTVGAHSTPWSQNDDLTVTSQNMAALGDIVFTDHHQTLHVDFSALATDSATGTFALLNKIVNFGVGDAVVVDSLSMSGFGNGIKSSFDGATGAFTISAYDNKWYAPYIDLTFSGGADGSPPGRLVAGSPQEDGPIAVTVPDASPGDPADGVTGNPTAIRADPTTWAEDAESWESPEFLANWGDAAINAQYAYPLGITGSGVRIGLVDSGTYTAHQEFSGNPDIVPVTAQGTYGTTGFRYEDPNDKLNDAPDAGFTGGESFSIPGTFDAAFNDLHGTTIAGVLAAARNGTGMQGVANGSTVYIGNSGGTDHMDDGPNQDYDYFKAVYGAVATEGARVINTSWGEDYSKSDYRSLQGLIDTYVLFQDRPSWLDAVTDTVKQYGEIQTWAAGNDSGVVPIISASLPYLQPDLEGEWIAVEAETKGSDPASVGLADFSNKAGDAKYWTIAAPGNGIYVTGVGGPLNYSAFVDAGDPNPYIDWGGGTSDAAPHAEGALALIMQRYGYLDNEEARDVLLTTAYHHDAVDGTADDSTGLAKDDAPNAIWGWGAVDLKAAMDGPGQFLGAFTVDMAANQSDTWNNAITEDALIQRKGEDAAEQAAWRQTLATKGWDKTPPTTASSVADQVAYAVGTARATAAAERADQGTLVKKGSGTLVLDGASSTYSGGTELDGGALEIGALGAAGTGAITFGAGPETLIVDQAAFGSDTTLANTLSGLGLDDTLDFKDFAFGGRVTAHLGGDAIDLAFGSTDYRLTLADTPRATLQLASDGGVGTLVSFAALPPPSDGGGSAGQPDPTPPATVPPVTTAPPDPTPPVTVPPVSTVPDPYAPVTVQNPDGSTTTAVAAPDGTTTITVLIPDGSSSVKVEGGPFFHNRPYASYTDSYAPDGTQLEETRDRTDGNHAIAARAPGQTIASIANDTLSGNGQASTTFEFTPGFGHDNVLGFDAFGPDHGTLSLASSSSASLLDVLHDTHNSAAGAVITDPTTGDTITVFGVTKAQLLRNKADISLHI